MIPFRGKMQEINWTLIADQHFCSTHKSFLGKQSRSWVQVFYKWGEEGGFEADRSIPRIELPRPTPAALSDKLTSSALALPPRGDYFWLCVCHRRCRAQVLFQSPHPVMQAQNWQRAVSCEASLKQAICHCVIYPLVWTAGKKKPKTKKKKPQNRSSRSSGSCRHRPCSSHLMTVGFTTTSKRSERWSFYKSTWLC